MCRPQRGEGGILGPEQSARELRVPRRGAGPAGEVCGLAGASQRIDGGIVPLQTPVHLGLHHAAEFANRALQV